MPVRNFLQRRKADNIQNLGLYIITVLKGDLVTMLLGKAVRLGRLLTNPSGKFLSVAVDHGIANSYDWTQGLDRFDQIIAARPDAITMMKGTASHYLTPYAGQIPWIMQTTAFPPHRTSVDYQLSFVEDAIALGADAIAMTISVVGDEQGEMIAMLGRLVTEARPVGLPVIAHIYPKGNLARPEDFTSLPYVRYAARVGVEVGVDIIKIPYTGSPETFAEIVDACPVPVVAAGGPRLDSLEALFTMVRGVIDAGARGLTIGRNVWQARHIPATIAALKAIVHENKPVAQALEIYYSLSGSGN